MILYWILGMISRSSKRILSLGLCTNKRSWWNFEKYYEL